MRSAEHTSEDTEIFRKIAAKCYNHYAYSDIKDYYFMRYPKIGSVDFRLEGFSIDKVLESITRGYI